jgi:hypothetical protein
MRFRLALGLAVVLAACSGGGSNGPSVPSVPWGEFRHDDSNAAVGGFINNNDGNVTLLASFPSSGPKSTGALATASTPTIDHNNNIILGTSKGILAIGSDGTQRWAFEGFMPSPITPSGTQSACTTCSPDSDPNCQPVGSVSASPTVSPGNAVVFGNDGSDRNRTYLFAIQERPDTPDCLWAAPMAGTHSSAIAQIYTLDLSLQTIYSAADDGMLRALNSDGSMRWSVSASNGPITSTPALDGTGNIYVTTPDGMLLAYDSSGRPLTSGFPFSTGVPPVTTPYQPSPGIGPSAYVIGADGTLFQGKPQGWQFRANNPPFIGSPAFLIQSITFMSTTTNDTVIYAVDMDGTAYAIRNQTGEILQAQRCSEDVNLECRTDSCNPTGATPPVDTCSPSTPHRCEISGQVCTEDTCVADNQGTCVVSSGPVSFAAEPGETVSITGSPILSGDPFVVVGTVDGEVCARSLANLVPGHNLSPVKGTWRGGYCSTTTVQTCVVDSDCPKNETCSAPSSCTTNKGCGTPGGHCSIATGQICMIDGDCPQIGMQMQTCVAAGPHCSVTTMLSCANDNNCPTNEYCVFVGCIPLTDNGTPDGGPVKSSPIIGIDSTVYVTTAKGLYVIK